MKHDQAHEADLARLLTEGPGALGSALRAELDGCPACRQTLERLRLLEQRILQDAGLERELLDEARREARPDDQDAVRNALADRNFGRRSGARPWRLGLVLLSLAAAVVAVILLRAPESGQRVRTAPEVLLGNDFELRVVVRDGRYDAFEWAHELLPGESYELSFHELEGELVGATLATHPGLTIGRYAPTAEEEARLPERMGVTVTVRDGENAARARASLTVSRR